ncbi:MFS transporter [Fulvivirga kasyanovii]|uniref:MFS transporter n=1 Tax=Fulvivirga kasyanovii TaxID=396812 RepID=A0ABW9RSW3_9BACT|nr:MFS transporter [Fulvivirga kasyanovii]MTI27264.1 MFS transporter [Fulvivirga kasyanovii]
MRDTRLRPGYVLPIIVIAQFAGTSLWFAGNAILPDLDKALSLPANALGIITSAVQLGFIAGTLTFAFLTIADRFSPSKVFFTCALLGSIFNLGPLFSTGYEVILSFRFITGFFLAGIYPIGMKIASDWHEKGLGKALGYLVGALVLGTAFPHLIRDLTGGLPWKYILIATSSVAVMGGVAILAGVGDGPFRKRGSKFDLSIIFKLFRHNNFRNAAFGYFGHMWELYAFWAFIPFILRYYNASAGTDLNVPLWSFITIGAGSLSCAIGGHVAMRFGSKKVAFAALALSGICCLLSPLLFMVPVGLFILILLIWGMAVVADSPQFSTLVAQTADKAYIGTGLTVVNSLGFAITIVSIQLLTWLDSLIAPDFLFIVLLIGPAFGLVHLGRVGTEK